MLQALLVFICNPWMYLGGAVWTAKTAWRLVCKCEID